jgi:hypothetical protein
LSATTQIEAFFMICRRVSASGGAPSAGVTMATSHLVQKASAAIIQWPLSFIAYSSCAQSSLGLDNER